MNLGPDRVFTTFALVFGASLGVGCGSTSPGSDAGDTADAGVSADSGSRDASDPNVLVGSFQVKLIAPVAATASTAAVPGSTAILGKVYDGPTPSSIVWETSQTSGSCALFLPRVPTCTSPCGGSALCVEDETCQAYPTSKSVGSVRVTGIMTSAGATELTMSAIANNYQPPAGTSLPFPAFAEGDTIRFETSGGAYAVFTLEAKGIAPLVVPEGRVAITSGQPLQLSWTAPSHPELSSVHVKLDINHHGGSKGMIACDVPDTGSLELPASLLTQLINLGVAGFPSVILTRSSKGSVSIAPGRVDLVISSEVEREITVPGLESCTDNSQCTNGKTCGADLVCR